MKLLLTSFISLIIMVHPQLPITSKNASEVVEIESWTSESSLISDLAFSSDGRMLITVSGSGLIDNSSINFLDTETLEPIFLTDRSLTATRLVISLDGTLLATGDESGQVIVYQFPSLDIVARFQGSDGRILSIAIDPTNRFIATTFGSTATGMEGDTIFQVFDLSSNATYFSLPCTNMDEYGCNGPYGSAVAFDDLGETLYLATSDSVITMWDVETMQDGDLISENYSILPHDMIYYDDGLGYITSEGSVRFLTSEDTYQDFIVAQSNNQVLEFPYTLAISPNGSILAVAYGKSARNGANRDAVLRFWDFENREILRTIEITTPQDDPIYTLAFSPDGTLLASGGADGTVRLWGVPADE